MSRIAGIAASVRRSGSCLVGITPYLTVGTEPSAPIGTQRPGRQQLRLASAACMVIQEIPVITVLGGQLTFVCFDKDRSNTGQKLNTFAQ